MAYEAFTTHFKMQGWPDGVPGVQDEAGNLICICHETHGVAFADLIARALNQHSLYPEKERT